MGFAQPGFVHEAHLFISPNSTRIGGVHFQIDPMQVQGLETVSQHQQHGLGPITLVPERFLANHNADFRLARAPVEIEKAGGADQYPILLLLGLYSKGLLFRRPLEHLLEPVLLARHGHGEEGRDAGAHFGVVDPGNKARQVAAFDGAEADALTVDHAGLAPLGALPLSRASAAWRGESLRSSKSSSVAW